MSDLKTISSTDEALTPLNSDIKRFKSEQTLASTDSSDTSGKVTSDLYASNIDKIVHELKSIGSTMKNTEKASSEPDTTPNPVRNTKPICADDNNHLLRKIFANKRRMRSLFSFKPTKLSSFIANLVKQQQYYILSSNNSSEVDRNALDTSIISESFLNNNQEFSGDENHGKSQQTDEKLPGIVNILNKSSSSRKGFDILKKIRKMKRETHLIDNQNTNELNFDGKLTKISLYFMILLLFLAYLSSILGDI